MFFSFGFQKPKDLLGFLKCFSFVFLCHKPKHFQGFWCFLVGFRINAERFLRFLIGMGVRGDSSRGFLMFSRFL